MRVRLFGDGAHLPLCVSHGKEARQPASLGFILIDREGVVGAAAGVADMVSQAAKGFFVDGVDEVEDQRRVNVHDRVETGGLAPGFKADA